LYITITIQAISSQIKKLSHHNFTILVVFDKKINNLATMNITPQNNPKEFEQFLFNKIGLNQFHYKFLKDYLEGVIAGTKKLYDKSILNVTSDGGWILILHGEGLFIYGENWSPNQFDEIRNIIDLNQFNNFIIIGSTELIDSLLKFYKVTNVCYRKDRILYRTTMIKEFENQNLKIALGDISERDELSLMLQQYYHEEYKGEMIN